MVYYNQISQFCWKVQKKFIQKIPQIHFYCIFRSKFFKNFQIFKNFRKPRAFGTIPPLSQKKIGGRIPEIAELQLSTVVLKIH